MSPHQRKIAVIGLGYVGLPVVVAFGQKEKVIAFDINVNRIRNLKLGQDDNNETDKSLLLNPNIYFTAEKEALQHADFFIITVPTPSDETHKPDLSYINAACEIVGLHLKVNDIVVFESTLYPGATQEACIPQLEHYSHLKAGIDFSVGYSPERINPGDSEHSFSKITKVISALDEETLDIIDIVYSSVIAPGVYRAANIKVAELSKVIENTQRDLNIALMNELAIICEKMKIDTLDVIHCAKTKWNFMPFYPGLVGGHCIGIDPYYLTYKAKQLGYRPEVILAGRRINDGMGKYIADQTVKNMIHAGSQIKGTKAAVLGLTFKENCKDIRNSKVIDVIHELQSFGLEILVHDPIADKEEALKEYEIELLEWEEIYDVDAIILCVAHQFYRELAPFEYAEKYSHGKVLTDVKSILDKKAFIAMNIHIWNL